MKNSEALNDAVGRIRALAGDVGAQVKEQKFGNPEHWSRTVHVQWPHPYKDGMVLFMDLTLNRWGDSAPVEVSYEAKNGREYALNLEQPKKLRGALRLAKKHLMEDARKRFERQNKINVAKARAEALERVLVSDGWARIEGDGDDAQEGWLVFEGLKAHVDSFHWHDETCRLTFRRSAPRLEVEFEGTLDECVGFAMQMKNVASRVRAIAGE